MASTTRKTTAAKKPAKKATSPRRAAAPKYRAERKGSMVHVFDKDGNRVALFHRARVAGLADAALGKTLRKYIEIEADGRIVGWAPLDPKQHAAVFRVAKAAAEKIKP